MLVSILAFLLLFEHPVCSAKRPNRPSLLRASRLVIEISKVDSCDEPGNAIKYFNINTKMISKVDFSLSADFNITRSTRNIENMLIQITKCRESVSSNTCELFQTWRFEKNPCKMLVDPNAVWRSALDLIRPRPACPFKEGTYSMRNVTVGTSVLEKVPLPWEGNVWLIRLGMMETKTRFHQCTDTEMHAHRVRDN